MSDAHDREDAAEAAIEVASQEIPPAPADEITRQDKGKLLGLLVVVALLVVATFLLWRYFSQLSTDAGREALVEQIRDAGFWGAFILLGLQVVQVVVAVVPGEIVEILGGVIYGPWLGTLIIMVGVVLASAAIFGLVRKLGYPFVSKVVSQKDLNRFKWLTDSKRLGFIVFLLYLCPGLPKDVLCYLVPLTDIKASHFLALSALGRLPGCLVLAFGGHTLFQGDYTTLAIILGCALVVVALALAFRKRILAFLERRGRSE